MKSLSFLIFILFGVPLVAHASLAPTLTLSPTKYDLHVQAGQVQQVTIKLTNRSDVALPIKTEVLDFAPRDDKGAVEFGHAIPGHSAKDWLKTDQTDLLIKPNETKKIAVTISPPDTVQPGSYLAVMMFETGLPDSATHTQTETKIVPWMGELFLLSVGEIPTLTDQALTVDAFSLPRVTNKSHVPVTLTLHNHTLFHLTPETAFQLETVMGTVVAQTKEDTTVLPESSRTIQAELVRTTPLGLYWGNATIHLASYSRIVAKQPLMILTWKGGIALALLLLFLGFMQWHPVFRRRVILSWKTFQNPDMSQR